MGYHKMTIEDIYSIFRRWNHKQNITQISNNENFDRKTVRNYIRRFKDIGLTQDKEYRKDDVIHELINLLPNNSKSQPVQEILQKHQQEIFELLTHNHDPVKVITAFNIIKEKYDFRGSYETFKLFVNKNELKRKKQNNILRIETPPGLETQIDYGKVGLHVDSTTGKSKTVYAYCGILSCSRLPFIDFVYKQDEVSFVQSGVRMNEFYGGVTDFISLDNLKSGVIKPDIYDPKLNKTFHEFAQHYGIFINPCRVATPTDKGKIERFIQVARELFKQLKYLHPDSSLQQLSVLAWKWCKEKYGIREHGTTKCAPITVYQEKEADKLKPLPDDPFEACHWHEAKVHLDQFISVNKKRYSLPEKYIGETVSVKRSSNKVMIYCNYTLIRYYLIPKNSMAYEPADFPEVKREMMNGGYPKYLLTKARSIGEQAHKLVESILNPHAYLNCRRARGVLDILEKHRHKTGFNEICELAMRKSIKLPKTMKQLFEEQLVEYDKDDSVIISEAGKAMTRNIGYFLN